MPRAVHRDQVRNFLVGVVVLLLMGAVAWVGIVVQGGGELPAKPYTYVTAAFRDVGTLKQQQGVAIGGVHAGTITTIRYQGREAIVTLRLDGERKIYRNARATIRNMSALGRKEVVLDPGTPSAGRIGSTVIPTSQTKDSVMVDDIFTEFDPKTRAAVRTSLRELGGGMFGHSSDLHDFVQKSAGLLDSLGTISKTLANPETDLPSLLRSADQLTGRLQGREEELAALLRTMDKTFRAVTVDGATQLRDTVQELPPTLRDTQRGLQALNAPLQDVQTAVATLRPGARALGNATPNLRGFFREAVNPLNKVSDVSDQATPAVEDLTRTVSDARPLVPRLGRTLQGADGLLSGLAPYAPDLGRFVSEHDMLSGHIAPGKHFFSAFLAEPGLYTGSLKDPMADVVPYPRPGFGAWQDQPGKGGHP